jgi:hypothetical protein
MKYEVGDALFVKKCEYKSRFLLLLRLGPRLPLPLHLHLHNTVGIITEVEKHSDIFEKDSTENDNGYIWYSQVDGREYYFYQDEVECEVFK